MFENLNITAIAEENALRIHLQWRWIEGNGETPPSCSVFCCPVPEQVFLNQMLFRQEDIINYINRELVDVSSPATRVQNIEEFYRHSAEQNIKSSLYQYSLMGDIVKHVDLPYPKSDSNKVFFLCVFGERSFVTKVISAAPLDSGIRYDIKQKTGFMNKLFGNKNPYSIEFESVSPRRMVVVTRYGNEEIYSIVPFGESKYYFSPEVRGEDISTVRYMSSLIGH